MASRIFSASAINDTTLGGYNYDDTTAAFVTRWLRTKGEALRAEGKPWYLAVNFVNPHDVMYVNSDLPEENIQSKLHSMPIARPAALNTKNRPLKLPPSAYLRRNLFVTKVSPRPAPRPLRAALAKFDAAPKLTPEPQPLPKAPPRPARERGRS